MADSLTNSWSPVDYETGSETIDPYYESVTNQIPTTGKSQSLFNLEVSEE